MTMTTETLPAPTTDLTERAFLKAFGKKVRIRRVTCDMSQEQLAQAARMSRNFVSSVERGAHGVDIVRVLRLARALHVTLPELLPDIEDFITEQERRKEPERRRTA